MNGISRALLRLYPKAWRARYGNEFQALLDDAPPGFGGHFDLFRGALRMQLSRLSLSKLALGLSVAGLAAGWASSFLVARQYESGANLMITAVGSEHRDPAGWLLQMENDVTSRTRLARAVQDPRLDLYPKEREHTPLEDVIETMQRRDIRIYPIPHPGINSADTLPFYVGFRYPDPRKAQTVVQMLLVGFQESNLTRQRQSARLRNADNQQIQALELRIGALEQKLGVHALEPQPIPHVASGFNLEVLDAPSTPEASAYPNRGAFALLGFSIGLSLAIAIGLVRRFSRQVVALPA